MFSVSHSALLLLPVALAWYAVLTAIVLLALRSIARLEVSDLDAPERIMDFLLASVLGLLSLPILLPLLAIAKLSSGKASPFRSVSDSIVVGLGSRPFRTWRLRGSRPGAHTSGKSRPAFGYVLPSDDQSLTSIGRFGVRTGFGNLTMLMNVILGDMAFFGPKPYRKEEIEKVLAAYPELLTVRPGLISPWHAYRYRVDFHSFVVFKLNDPEERMKIEAGFVSHRRRFQTTTIFLKVLATMPVRWALGVKDIEPPTAAQGPISEAGQRKPTSHAR